VDKAIKATTIAMKFLKQEDSIQIEDNKFMIKNEKILQNHLFHPLMINISIRKTVRIPFQDLAFKKKTAMIIKSLDSPILLNKISLLQLCLQDKIKEKIKKIIFLLKVVLNILHQLKKSSQLKLNL
jgi:hypothetical protein